MRNVTAKVVGLVALLVALFPLVAEAGLWENHNETLVRDRR